MSENLAARHKFIRSHRQFQMNQQFGWREACRYLCQCRRVNKRNCLKDESFCSRFIDSRVFMPDHHEISRVMVLSPDTYGLPYEIVSIKTQDNYLLMAYLIIHRDQNYGTIPTILFCHGNGGNIGDCLPIAQRLFQETACNVLVLEYRGFGFSQGSPSEEGVYLDAQSGVDFILSRPDLDHHKILIYGISLGGAVAIDLATTEGYRDHVAALILENTFSSLEEIVIGITPKICRPLLKLLELSKKFASLHKISRVTAPTLFLSGLKDNFIEPEHMTKLYLKCGAEMKKLVRFPNGEHLSTWTAPNYASEIGAFLHATLDYTPLVVVKSSWVKRGRALASPGISVGNLNSKSLITLKEALESLPIPDPKKKSKLNQ